MENVFNIIQSESDHVDTPVGELGNKNLDELKGSVRIAIHDFFHATWREILVLNGPLEFTRESGEKVELSLNLLAQNTKISEIVINNLETHILNSKLRDTNLVENIPALNHDVIENYNFHLVEKGIDLPKLRIEDLNLLQDSLKSSTIVLKGVFGDLIDKFIIYNECLEDINTQQKAKEAFASWIYEFDYKVEKGISPSNLVSPPEHIEQFIKFLFMPVNLPELILKTVERYQEILG